MPHLMNCSHSSDGWCLKCVKELWEEHNGPHVFKVYKIEIRHKSDNVISLKRLYESKEQYEKWMKKHKRRYGKQYYTFDGFVIESSGWRKIE